MKINLALQEVRGIYLVLMMIFTSGVTNKQPSKSSSKPKAFACHECNEPGHIRPNYPNRVKKVSSPVNVTDTDYISALVNGKLCSKCIIDSGSSVSLIANYLVDPSCYTGNFNSLKTYRTLDEPSHVTIAKVHLKVGDLDQTIEVAVCDNFEDDMLLGHDLGKERLGECF